MGLQAAIAYKPKAHCWANTGTSYIHSLSPSRCSQLKMLNYMSLLTQIPHEDYWSMVMKHSPQCLFVVIEIYCCNGLSVNTKISLLLLLFSLLALTAYTNVGGLCSELKYLHVELMNAMLVGVFDLWTIFSPLIVRLCMVGMHTLLSVAKLCNRILGITVYTLQSQLLRIAICPIPQQYCRT